MFTSVLLHENQKSNIDVFEDGDLDAPQKQIQCALLTMSPTEMLVLKQSGVRRSNVHTMIKS